MRFNPREILAITGILMAVVGLVLVIYGLFTSGPTWTAWTFLVVGSLITALLYRPWGLPQMIRDAFRRNAPMAVAGARSTAGSIWAWAVAERWLAAGLVTVAVMVVWWLIWGIPYWWMMGMIALAVAFFITHLNRWQDVIDHWMAVWLAVSGVGLFIAVVANAEESIIQGWAISAIVAFLAVTGLLNEILAGGKKIIATGAREFKKMLAFRRGWGPAVVAWTALTFGIGLLLYGVAWLATVLKVAHLLPISSILTVAGYFIGISFLLFFFGITTAIWLKAKK
jgi:hypothetical protein